MRRIIPIKMRRIKTPQKQTVFNRPFTLNSIIPHFVCLSVLFFLIYVIYLQNLQILELQEQLNLLKFNLADVAIKKNIFLYKNWTGLMLFSFVIGIIFGYR